MTLRLLPGNRIGVEGLPAWLKTMTASSFYLGPAAWAISVAGRRDSHRVHDLERWWGRRVERFLRVEVDARGTERVDGDQAYVVAPLHEGFADALALLRLPLDLRFVARDELFEWPTLGRYLRDSSQVLVRTHFDRTSYRGLLRGAEQVFGRGESLVAFPQGTILGIESAFHRGAFTLADRFGVPVLPVVLTGSHRVWEYPFSPRLRFGEKISMRVLDSLPVGEASKRARVTERLMKRLAVEPGMAPVRRFRPEVDGYWDGYPYQIDEEFPEVAELVDAHRAVSAE